MKTSNVGDSLIFFRFFSSTYRVLVRTDLNILCFLFRNGRIRIKNGILFPLNVTKNLRISLFLSIYMLKWFKVE